MVEKPKVSIVITNFNPSHMLPLAKLSFSSAFLLNYDNYEVILVDSASSDGLGESLQKIGQEFSKNTGVHSYFIN